MNYTGLFGKLPAHGDFISRRLPQSFISVWDEWLQCSVAGSQEILGESWLDIFLTSPIWRFVLRPGAIDGRAWAGILVPSVDSVGRYFPLTLARSVDNSTDVLNFISHQSAWFSAMESAAMSALQEQMNADQILVLINEFEVESLLKDGVSCKGESSLLSNGSRVMTGGSFAAQFIELIKEYEDFSGSIGVWACTETESFPAQTLLRKGLPDTGEYTGMINGRFD